jgi:DNA-binding response OmpR family regulator
MTARTILIVDDDTELREALVEQLSLYDEFETIQADSAASGIAMAKEDHVDLLLMDVGLPDIDGREAVKLLRKNGFKAPVIMLTGHDTDSDTILGLEAGANDYVPSRSSSRCCSPGSGRICASTSRARTRPSSIGRYSFRPAAKLMLDEKGSKVRLTEKETSILKFLYRAGEKPVTRDVLLHEVWGYNSGVTTHTLETHIYRLRQKIERDPSNAELLVTEAGGYKLVP